MGSDAVQEKVSHCVRADSSIILLVLPSECEESFPLVITLIEVEPPITRKSAGLTQVDSKTYASGRAFARSSRWLAMVSTPRTFVGCS